MGKGGKFGFKHSTRRGVLSKEQGSDESDEDYNVGADEEFDESDDCSFDGDDSEVSLGEFEDEEEEDDEDDEEDEEEEEMKVRKVAKPKGRGCFPGRKANAVMKPEKRKRVSYKEEDDDDDEYDDDDDEEFKPDEIDFVDDEDEVSVMEKNKKVVRPCVREKGFAKGRKRKRNSKVLKKPMRKKLRKSGRLVKETSSGDDGEFTGKKLVVEERSKKISGRRRRRRFKPHSDSDFVSSGSSDFEYTISEEEREQVREGSKICTSLTTSLRSSSSSKRLQEEVPRQQLKRPGRKGKEKVEDLKNEAGKQVCGICLSEEGKNTVRGTLNCCDHYFCFACIMEWSKVESRCPLCKQRFVTIGKTARSNTSFDLRTMVIHVPERDQVYQPSEEELRGYLDPYESVICTECHQGGDDSLMLLCDVCDSPAHTYCVGLGHEVPEGNWYCEGCRPTAFGSLNPQGLSPAPDRRATSNLSGVSSPVYNIGEGIDLNMTYVPDTPLTQETEVFSSSRRAVGDFHAGPPAFGSGANTVSERRRIRYRISNMLNHSDGRSNGVSARNLGTRLFGYQLDLGREVEPQHTITPESVASHHTFPEGRLQDNTTPFVHNRDGFSSGLSYSSGRGQNPISASAFGMEFNPGLNYEQLPPFSTISVVGSDASASHYACREGTASSRASQGAVHTPF